MTTKKPPFDSAVWIQETYQRLRKVHGRRYLTSNDLARRWKLLDSDGFHSERKAVQYMRALRGVADVKVTRASFARRRLTYYTITAIPSLEVWALLDHITRRSKEWREHARLLAQLLEKVEAERVQREQKDRVVDAVCITQVKETTHAE